MKLQEVDDTINEGLSKWVQLGIGGLAKAVGSSIGAKKASSAYEQEHFIETFVSKMNGMLGTVWPKIQKSQQDAAKAKQMLDLINAGKPIIMGNRQITPDNPQYGAYKAQYQRMMQDYEEFDLAKYLVQVITQYATGYNLTQYQGELQGLSSQVANSYQVNRGTPALKKIGKLLYDVIKQAQPSQPEEPSETARVKLTQVLPLLDRMTSQDLQKLNTELQKKIQELG